MNRKLFICSFFFLCNVLYSQNNVNDLFWPKELYDVHILKRFESLKFENLTDIENEYYYILDYLFNSIIAHKRNCNNYYENIDLITYVPMYKNGKLEIIEETRTVNYYDIDTKESYEKADISVLLEYSQYCFAIFTYNQLIDFWHTKTGIYLKNKLNIDSLKAGLWNKHMWNDKHIKEKIFTPEEYEEYKKEYLKKYSDEL
jgi:hypothetical protein